MLRKMALCNLARLHQKQQPRAALPAPEPVAAVTPARAGGFITLPTEEYEALMEALNAKNEYIDKLQCRLDEMEGHAKSFVKAMGSQSRSHAMAISVLGNLSKDQDKLVDELRGDIKVVQEEKTTLVTQVSQLRSDLKASGEKSVFLAKELDVTKKIMMEVVDDCDEAREELEQLRPQACRLKSLESKVAELNSELAVFRCPPTPSLVCDDDDDDDSSSLSESPTIRAISSPASPSGSSSGLSGLSSKDSTALSSQALISDAEFLAGVNVDGWLADLPALGLSTDS